MKSMIFFSCEGEHRLIRHIVSLSVRLPLDVEISKIEVKCATQIIGSLEVKI